jgi:anti-sigma factor RsiW
VNDHLSLAACNRAQLHAWHDGELSTARGQAVSRHLRHCRDCQDELRWLQALDRGVRGLRRQRATQPLKFHVADAHLAASRGRAMVRHPVLRWQFAGVLVAAGLWLMVPVSPSSREAPSALHEELAASIKAGAHSPTDPELVQTAQLARRVQQHLRDDVTLMQSMARQ